MDDDAPSSPLSPDRSVRARRTRPRPHRRLRRPLVSRHRQRARQLPALSDRALRPARPAPARPGARGHPGQRLLLRAPGGLPARRRHPQPRLHRPLPARLLRPGEQADRPRVGHRRLGQGHAACPRPGRSVRPRTARGREPAALRGGRRRRPQHRALQRIQPDRRGLHPLSGPTLPPHPARRPAPARDPRPAARALAGPAEPRPQPASRPRHPRHRRPVGAPRGLPGVRRSSPGPDRLLPDPLPLHPLRRGRRTHQRGRIHRPL